MYRGKQLMMTNAGRTLLARAQAGETARFTRMKLGSSYNASYAGLTDLVSAKLPVTIRTSTAAGSVLTVSGYYLRTDVTTSFVWKEFGIFGKLDSEAADYLIAYSYDADGDTVISSDDVLDMNELNVSVEVGDASGSFGEIDPSGLATLATVNALLALKANAEHTHTPNQVGSAPVDHASTGTGYGVSTATKYGHAKAGTTLPKPNGTANAGTETDAFARADHVHPSQTEITGNAGSANKLKTARTIAFTGAATGSGAFDGSGNILIALTLAGITPVANGGTGASTAEQARTNIGAAPTTHTHTAGQISGVMSVGQGGTGAGTASEAMRNLGYLANCVIVSSETPEVVDGMLWLKPVV